MSLFQISPSANKFFPSKIVTLIGACFFVLITACGGGGSSEDTNDNNPQPSNSAPIANAGSDQNVEVGSSVTLNGANSSDADGDSLTYQWQFNSLPSTSNASLLGANAVQASFTADVVGTYQVALTVNDGTVDSSADVVVVTVSEASVNSAPTANAGSDQMVAVSGQVNLDGTASSDPEGDSLSYSWTFSSRPNGSSAALNNATSSTPNFTADVAGDYSISLIVNDGELDSNVDSVLISAEENFNNIPVAKAGNDRVGLIDELISLDGSESNDVDGDSLTYSWSLEDIPSTSSASMQNANTVSPSFTPDVEGSYVVALVVNDGTENSETDRVIINVARWLTNTTERSTFVTENGQGVLVNVQSVETVEQSQQTFVSFSTTGIPNYTVTMTQDDIDGLNNRPNARTDFSDSNGRTTASVGDIIEFGQNIGYVIQRAGCELGYWPPGPECPSNQSKSSILPVEPEPASTSCETGLNSIGVMLNGTSVFNWGDGQSYNNQRVWTNLAPKFEVYDVDVCLGHAQLEGDYHHHMYSKCLQDLMADDGNSHSPIYGFAADGYPIHGPYFSQGVLAKPSWVIRDYENTNSATGCGEAGKRTCQLVDQYDISQGVITVTSGPDTSETVDSMSQNPIETVAGVYFEDYYHDSALAELGNEYLDQHNGHEHDNLGYHYHITVEDIDGNLEPLFPYQIGPSFYGEIPSGGLASCN